MRSTSHALDDVVAGTPASAIAASINPRIRIVAGPGTGKSFAMKRRVARLLEEGVVAAEDLHRELVGMSVPGCDSLNGVTLHSLSLKMLMRITSSRPPAELRDPSTNSKCCAGMAISCDV
jgi:DNA helicase II / ATP-dependent DNA helicase PcrA